MSWEVISGICAVIGVGYLIYQFHYLPLIEKKEAANSVVVQIGVSRKLASNLINELKAYAVMHDAYNDWFTGTVTFNAQIAHLEHLLNTELDETIEQQIKEMKLTKNEAELFVTGLKNQIHSFNQLQAHFDTSFKFR